MILQNGEPNNFSEKPAEPGGQGQGPEGLMGLEGSGSFPAR